MRAIKKVILLLLFVVFLYGTTSCVVMAPKDNGNHKGWYKNSNNPHHSQSTNPGKSQGNQKK